jgi:class 3 adenylate cyclase/tetratricopeptide (TPR) repeat protein
VVTTCPSCGSGAADDARFCANCGASLQPVGGEERKLATIVFADVIGSTDLGEQLDPERLRSVLGDYFGEMSRVIAEWGGTVEKFIGDAVVAFFGVPQAREDDPIRALNAASGMLAALVKLNADLEARHGIRLGVRIGVNTGEVLAPAAIATAGQFVVSGDAVNVAARLEQAADAGTILVGERTWLAARNAFDFGEPVPLTLKGKREPVVARALGERLAGEQRGVRFQAPMVGRERELATVLGLLDEAVESGRPRLGVIGGPAGIGKSRMLREFIATAAENHADLFVLRGRCLAAGHGITFWALGEILRSACRISLDEPTDSAAQKLVETVDSLLAPLGLSVVERDETVHALAMSAGLNLTANPLAELEPEQVGEAMARAWPRFVTALARRSPVALVVEDLHWADDRMVTLLDLIAGRSAGPVLLLGTARPEFMEAHPGLASGDLTTISLRPLTDAQSDRLVAELLGDSEELQALAADVRQKADGNPFFLEEILQRLIDEGAIVHERGRWRPTARADDIQLPDTVHALLAARIDALPAAEKSVLQQAAVVGRVFWPGSIGGGPSERLRSLERRGLVSARPTSSIDGEAEYIFRHALIRDVAYGSVPKSRRARAHAAVAAWVEDLAGDRLEEFGELLAYHYSAAVSGADSDLAWANDDAERERIRRRAIEVSLLAGSAARQRFAVDKAIALHQQALDLSVGDSERARALEALGDDHDALFHMDEAVACYLDAVDAVRRSGEDDAMIGQLAAKVGHGAARWGAFREMPPVDRIRALIADALACDIDSRVRASLLVSQGSLAGMAPRGSSRGPLLERDRSRLPESIESAESGLAIAEQLDDPGLMYRANEVLSTLYSHAGAYDRQRAAVEREAALIDRLPSPRQQTDVLVSHATALGDSGQYRQSLAVAERAYRVAANASLHERMHASFALMSAAEALGEWDRVLEVLAWHVEAARAEASVSCPSVRGGPPLGATVMARRGHTSEALGLVPIDVTGLAQDTLTDRAVFARYAVAVGARPEAEAIVDEIISRSARTRYPDGMVEFLEAVVALERWDDLNRFLPFVEKLVPASALLGPVAKRIEALLMIREGATEKAQPLLAEAIRGFDALSVPFEAAQTRVLLARIAAPVEARASLEAAIETYVQLGARPYADAARATLGKLDE